jgi:23S rRNA (cytosine1962-C5)-methyltransferase
MSSMGLMMTSSILAPIVTLRPRKARPFFAGHPWVFAGSIARTAGDPGPGDEVRVLGHEGQFVARGLFNPASAIRVRLYRWEDAPLDDAFWRGRVAEAVRLRTQVLRLDGPCRLVFSEGDRLSGLTVDRYDCWLVVQFTSRALYERREVLLKALEEHARPIGMLLRVERGLAAKEGLEDTPGVLQGTPPEGPIEVIEEGLSWEVDLTAGQKTGSYLDQRDNRRAVATYARGRRMLDLFCYTGGFSLVALRHGEAAESVGVDSSARAIDVARRNAERNGMSSARFEVGDVGATLDRLRAAGERFGLVVVDPPKFARDASGLDEALKGYVRLNRAAVDVLAPDGVLATCSCSGLVDRAMFAEVLGRVAELSGRPIQILEMRGQAADHPVSASCLETDYLKCAIVRLA